MTPPPELTTLSWPEVIPLIMELVVTDMKASVSLAGRPWAGGYAVEKLLVSAARP
jgi:hypothetical protein